MEYNQLFLGGVYRIASVHHPVFANLVGREVVAVKISGGSVWCSENKPVTYRTNRLGMRVLDHDPRCCMSLYSPEQLEPAAGVARAF